MNKGPTSRVPEIRATAERRRSQLLGLILLAILVLIIASIRYYFRVG